MVPLLGAGWADMVLTDPPYGINYSSPRRDDIGAVTNDGADLTWMAGLWGHVHTALKADTYLLSFYGPSTADQMLPQWRAAGFATLKHLVWIKNVWSMGRVARSQHETGWLLGKGSPPLPEPAPSDVLEWDRVQGHEHPTEKPLGALAVPLLNYCPAGGMVLDPFMGSGSTLRACKDRDLRAVGIEVEERFCEVAARRMRQGVLNFG